MSSAGDIKPEPMEQQVASTESEQQTHKRKAEDEPTSEEPAAKAVKTEGEGAAEAATGDEGAAEGAQGGDAPAAAGQAEGAAAEQAAAPPATTAQIGYKTFASGKEAKTYYHNLIAKLRKYQNLNDYEFHMVHELIKNGHPEAGRKLEGGVKAIQIREVEIGSNVTACFFLVHDDGSDEDVSYRKCLGSLFPELAKEMSSGSGAKAGSRSGPTSGGRGGMGRGRGGRGGRGRGRGRHH